MNSTKHYAKRDPDAQGIHYTNHVSAMTTEGLHAKSAIAAELAHRDIEIERLRAALAAPAQAAAQQGAAYAALEKKHNDFLETVGLMLDAIGYTEDYARQWPKEKVSVTFKRWFDEKLASHGQASSQAGQQNHLPLAITSAPERIWLDLGFNPYEEDAHFSNLHDLTWSQNNATGDGIEYVRADLGSND